MFCQSLLRSKTNLTRSGGVQCGGGGDAHPTSIKGHSQLDVGFFSLFSYFLRLCFGEFETSPQLKKSEIYFYVLKFFFFFWFW